MEPSTTDKSEASCDRAEERKSGQMAQNTKESGNKIARGGWESSPTKMATATKENGCTTRPTALAHTAGKMAAPTKADGEETSSTAREDKPGRTAATTKDNSYRESNKDSASTFGKTATAMRDIGKTTNFTVRGFKSCMTDDSTKATGSKDACTAGDSTSGRTARSIRASISWTKRKATAATNGEVEKDISDSGSTTNATAREWLSTKMAHRGSASGTEILKLDWINLYPWLKTNAKLTEAISCTPPDHYLTCFY